MSQQRMVAVSYTMPRGGTVVKRVRVSLLDHYERAGWHPVPRRRFKIAKREHERVAG